MAGAAGLGRRDYLRNRSASSLRIDMARAAYAKSRPAKPDIWLTISGWIWLAYAAVVLAILTAVAA